MNATRVSLSVLLPVYNAERVLPASLAACHDFMRTVPYEWELIVVDDGSQDRSAEIADRFVSAANDSRLRLLRSPSNLGKGAASRRGVGEARGRYLAFVDCDLAYPVDQVMKVVRALDAGADVAIACRALKDSVFMMSPAFFRYLYTRHVMGRLFNWIVRAWLLPGILDTQAGLKGFRRESIQEVFSRLTLEGFSFDVELLFVARWLGLRIEQVPVSFRYFEEPTTIRFIRDGALMVRDLLRIRWNAVRGRYGTRRSMLPTPSVTRVSSETS